MENISLMTPNMILQECLFGFEGIEDETKSKIAEEIIEISSDEENDEEKEVVKVEKVLRVKEEEVNHSMLGSDRKANLEDKVMKKSPEVALPYGWEKMKRELKNIFILYYLRLYLSNLF